MRITTEAELFRIAGLLEGFSSAIRLDIADKGKLEKELREAAKGIYLAISKEKNTHQKLKDNS